ncbi:Rossmann-like domain-containing protein [Actinopolyspora mortivallis]|uniref:Putative heavy-metal chelation domain-containing protein n=1 Tax=Actinopolyspora mortivallis TaxID=33906 RepID=A0A2T0GX38_ACTMO|nr:DUF364 domain-containing protein [Actinopolyspora mortivallis]PRW63671.1 hypothetical protein CEP50_09415 [Actinopolyspora mortivallis]
MRTTNEARSVEDLVDDVLSGSRGPSPDELCATSVFWVHHGTRLSGGTVTYRTRYVLVRVGRVFGACAFEENELDPRVCEQWSGATVERLLRHAPSPVRAAALDAYLGAVEAHGSAPGTERLVLPSGTPETRAEARDAAIVGSLDIAPGTNVALIGVVDPLVAAVRERGGKCVLCDFNLERTRWGDPVADHLSEVLPEAEAVIATGMTLGNGTFDVILDHCRRRGLPLVLYAQTGSHTARAFLGDGVTALLAEPFPFSQFSADPTVVYRYRAGSGTV